jgi:hypothetical protein
LPAPSAASQLHGDSFTRKLFLRPAAREQLYFPDSFRATRPPQFYILYKHFSSA